MIHGPASLNYDEDLGPFLVSDWYHNPAFSLWQRVEKMGSPPIADNGLINGMNTFDCGGGKDPRCRDTGRRYEKRVKKGKRYLVRLVNAAVDNHFKVSLDNHR